MLTALVVDPSPDARRRIGALLHLAGWHVLAATSAEEALQVAVAQPVDLVATDVVLPGETGFALLSRLRTAGSRARFLVVTADPTDRIRATAASVGALACLAKPIDPRALIDLLARRTGRAGPSPRRPLRLVRDVEDRFPAGVDPVTMSRLQHMFLSALPLRLSLIGEAARRGDAIGVAGAAQTLAGAAGQLGHAEIATACQGVAADARRGIVAQSRLLTLHVHCERVSRGHDPAAGRAALAGG